MSETAASPPALWKRLLWLLLMIVVWIVLAIWILWSVGFYMHALTPWPSRIMLVLFGLGVLAVLIFARRIKRPVGVAGVCLVGTIWYFAMSPSNDRDWHDDVSVTANAEIDGDTITIHGVRDNEYRSEFDYTTVFHSRTVQLSKLTHADILLCYWGSEWLAHPIVSFQFENAAPLCFSIEARKEKTEAYSTLGGLFRQYELYYSIAEERDVVLVRTQHREGEDVYLFRIKIDAERTRKLFLKYLETVNELHEKARFYHVLTSNCTTNVRTHSVATSRIPRPWDWRILLPGKLDELIAMRDGFVSDLPLEELKPRCQVDDAANRAGRVDDFSKRIREGVPGYEND